MESILIAKLEAPGIYSSAGIVNALRTEFKEVYEFNYQSIMYSEGADGMRRRLMGMCMMHNPDVCLLHMQTPECMDINLIQFLSEKTFVVLYTFDVRENIDWYKEYAPYVGLILFGDQESVEQMNESGFMNVDYLQSSADFDLYRPSPVPPDKDYGEIVFIGNNFSGSKHKFPLIKQRVDLVNYMKKHFGDRFKVYGMGWPGSRMLNPMEEIEAYHSCKIALTHNNFFRTGYTSDRQWRSMGSGAMTISQYYEGYENDFPSIISNVWQQLPTLKARCELLLENEYFRNDIARRQHDWVVKNHSWSVRISKLKQLIINHGYDKRMESIDRSSADTPNTSL